MQLVRTVRVIPAMADKNSRISNTNISADQRPVPSQAEGDDPVSSGTRYRPRPSQAEGDEKTIDESLQKKEQDRDK